MQRQRDFEIAWPRQRESVIIIEENIYEGFIAKAWSTSWKFAQNVSQSIVQAPKKSAPKQSQLAAKACPD